MLVRPLFFFLFLLTSSSLLTSLESARQGESKTGKPSKRKNPGKTEKGAKLTKQAEPVNIDIFTKFTERKTGGTCWWDLRRSDCAICKKGVGAMQCGYPMHKYCYKASDRFGCPGIPQRKYTFSTRGFPCFWDHTDYRCAWCSPGGYQCGPGAKTGPTSPGGSRCAVGRDKRYCDSVVGDCRHIPACDANASCRFHREFGSLNLFKCVCNKGFRGNGMQCVGQDGVIGKNPDKIVEVEMDLVTDSYMENVLPGVFPLGVQTSLFSQMSSVETGCKTNICQAKFRQSCSSELTDSGTCSL